MAASLVLVETNGSLKTLKAKEVSFDTLYKKCGFRVNDDFECRHTWKSVKITGDTNLFTVSVWAKKTGKANFENKYDFPPPIDKDLFFGTCAIVRTTDDGSAFLDLTKETWLKIYEKLFGGFEDIGDEDEYSEDELANVDPSLLTANGYLKDGFVVSDKSIETTPEDTTSEEEVVAQAKSIPSKKRAPSKKKKMADTADEETPKAKTKAKAKPKVVSNKSKSKPKHKESDVVTEQKTDDTTSELEDEAYTFSDDD
jgi:hypothetical protein